MMGLIWACDEKCNTTQSGYKMPSGWLAEPVYDSRGKFEGMRYTCPGCQVKKRIDRELFDPRKTT